MRKRLLESGFAVLALDAPTHGDRIAENDYALVNDYRPDNQPTHRNYFSLDEIDAGHRLPVAYVADALAWFEAHLK